jgi:hypothetical protein
MTGSDIRETGCGISVTGCGNKVDWFMVPDWLADQNDCNIILTGYGICVTCARYIQSLNFAYLEDKKSLKIP